MAITLSHSFTMSATDQEAMAPHFCEIHTVEEIRMFCNDCDELVCTQCIIRSHNGHHFEDISTAANNKNDELIEILNEMQDKLVPDVEDKLQKLQKLRDKNKNQCDNTIKMIRKRNDELRIKIETITNSRIGEAKKLEWKNNERISSSEAKLLQNLNDLRRYIDTCNDAKNSGDNIHLISTLKNVVTMRVSPANEIPAIYPPRFIPGELSPEIFETKFGNVPDDFEMEISSDTFLYELKNLESVKPFSAGIVSITPCADNTAFVRCHKSSNVNLIDIRGGVQQIINVGTKIDDVTLADETFLLSCPDIKEVIECTTEGRINKTVLKTSPFIPCGICNTFRNSFLVCLVDNVNLCPSDGSRRLVEEFNLNGEILNTIEFHNEKPLFTFPSAVSAARNGNIAVIDWTRPKGGRLLMFDSTGKFIFVYPSQGATINIDTNEPKSKFWPGCCAFDPSCNLLVTDMVTRSVYLFDTSRNVVKLMETNPETFPRTVGVSEDGKIWVGHFDGKIEIYEFKR